VASTFTGTWIAPALCSEGNQAATSLIANPTVPVAPTYGETFTANTSDLSAAIFNDPTCVPGAWSLDVVQSVGDPTPAASEDFGPLNLVNLTAVCSITGTGNCLVQQSIGQQVNGTNLTVTEYAATQGIGAPGQNPSAILVNLSTVTLGAGVFQAGQGALNTVEVNDSRGTLSGWTVTGVLTGDFIGPAVGNDNTIPADYLTWKPAISLTFPGNLAAGVAPYGTVSPPNYAPDAPVAGSAATGSNSNIKVPSVNDNAGAANAASGSNWPSAASEGPSGLLNEVSAGPVANLGTSDTGAPDYGAQPAQVLCLAPSGGGGGAFNCDASLSLAVPPYVAAGHYTATLDILTVAT
jgi:hypothetical protein